MMSIAASVLAADDDSTVTLLYGNRRSDTVMFADEVADLKDAYPARMRLVHVLSPRAAGGRAVQRPPRRRRLRRAAAGHRRRRGGRPLVAVRPVRHGHRRDRGAQRARRGARPHPPRAVLGRGRPARRGDPRRRPGRRRRQRDRHPRRPQQHADPARRAPRSWTAPSGSGPTCRSPARAASAAPAGPRVTSGDRSPCAATTPWSREESTPATSSPARRSPPPTRSPLTTTPEPKFLVHRGVRTCRTATSPPGELEPIETASADELRALQLERLRWSLRHAYENVPHYRKMFDVAARPPRRLQGPGRPGQVPVHHQGRRCATTTRSACSRCPASRSSGSTPRPAPPAAPPSSATPATTSTPGPR